MNSLEKIVDGVSYKRRITPVDVINNINVIRDIQNFYIMNELHESPEFSKLQTAFMNYQLAKEDLKDHDEISICGMKLVLIFKEIVTKFQKDSNSSLNLQLEADKSGPLVIQDH
ncbi:hypothetical protein KC669_03855 [Candidatus Dojkabacteria bacterium]|uniref:Uncharacterized protein n=1 Tax=Candidatus Dojkabacteria bacterium TaxID=2099670 RepID=A0A955LBT4_9BACT|nr:hypothetical protein [Candidatus Dojkabacteria bacterium]